MILKAWSKTDKGLRRESNQDSFLVNPDLGLYIVADGMGGHSGGEVASAMAVEVSEKYIKQNKDKKIPGADIVSQAYLESSRSIYKRATNENPELMGMGTTMVMLMMRGSSMFIGNVGDSRIYLHRAPFLWQLTEDHSLVYEQLRAGHIKDSQVKTFVGKNVITRSVGYEADVSADVLERPLMEGDRYLLCSDGLCGLVSDEVIADILNNNRSDAVVDECIASALQHGGDDNVTVVLVEVTSGS